MFRLVTQDRRVAHSPPDMPPITSSLLTDNPFYQALMQVVQGYQADVARMQQSGVLPVNGPYRKRLVEEIQKALRLVVKSPTKKQQEAMAEMAYHKLRIYLPNPNPSHPGSDLPDSSPKVSITK
jgi:hypothetical protein